MAVTRIIALIFGLVGLAMGSAAIWVTYSTLQFRATALHAEGEVIGFGTSRGRKGGTMYTPQVRFYVPAAEGGPGASVEIRGRVSSSSRSYDIGDRVDVYYPPEHPEDARIDSFMEQWFFPLIFGFFGLVFGGIASGFIVAEWRQRRLYAWLATHGMTVQAKLIEVARNTSVKVNGRSPWVLRAQWQHPLTQAVHVFESEHLWYDPSDYLRGRSELPVRVDADDPARHRVDLSWLPKQG